jgi:hypothetical protein
MPSCCGLRATAAAAPAASQGEKIQKHPQFNSMIPRPKEAFFRYTK